MYCESQLELNRHLCVRQCIAFNCTVLHCTPLSYTAIRTWYTHYITPHRISRREQVSFLCMCMFLCGVFVYMNGFFCISSCACSVLQGCMTNLCVLSKLSLSIYSPCLLSKRQLSFASSSLFVQRKSLVTSKAPCWKLNGDSFLVGVTNGALNAWNATLCTKRLRCFRRSWLS